MGGAVSYRDVERTTNTVLPQWHLMPQHFPGLVSLVRELLEKDQMDRPSALQALHDPWFTAVSHDGPAWDPRQPRALNAPVERSTRIPVASSNKNSGNAHAERSTRIPVVSSNKNSGIHVGYPISTVGHFYGARSSDTSGAYSARVPPQVVMMRSPQPSASSG